MNLQYRTLLNDRSKFAAMDKLLSDERLDLAACSTEPVIIQRSKEQTKKYYGEWVRSVRTFGKQTPSPLLLNDENHSIRIDQLFSPDSDGNTPKTVILSGDSGRGKSFMLQKIMLDWASGELYSENFDAVFLLKCEEFKSISTEESLFYLLSLNHSLTSKQISKILQLTPEKVLILIDGMDEYVSRPRIHFMQHTNLYTKAPVMVILTNLLRRVLLPESFMLVTTRSAVDTVNLLKDPQRFTEIMGFSERGVQEYFQKFFQDEQLFRKMYERVKINESLLTACSVPLLCWMVCFCLKKHFTDDDHVMRELKTNTSIYVHFVSTLLEHHDQSQSVLTMLRSLGQLAEEGMKKQQVFFVGKSVTMKCFDAVTTLFLYKDGLKIKDSQKPAFRFMHHSFQEFFTALYYVLLDEENSWWKVSELLDWMEWGDIIDRPSPERRSNPIPSVMLFLCGLLNKKVSSSLFKKIQWTVPHTVKLKEKLQESVLRLTTHSGCELYALHCLYELQDERFVSEALKKHNFMDLSNISLTSTDCWVLLYCLQCCPHVRYLNLMYCDLTAEKLKILQPALCMSKTMRLSVEHLSEVADLIQILGESKILRQLKVQEDENSAESPRWSLNLSITRGDVLLSLSSSEKSPSFPAVLNITLTCPQSEISSTDWSLFLERLSKTGKVAEDSSALDEHVSLLLSSFHSVGLKTLDLKLVSLNGSWASGIICLVQTCTSLQQLNVCADLLLEEGIMLLNKSLTDPHCTVIIEGSKSSKPTDQCKELDCSHSCYDKVKIHFKPKVLEQLKTLNISEPEPSVMNLYCQSCVHIGDSDQWVHVEPLACTDEGGSEFRISTPAGRFECSRTRMRWVCAGDITLQYRAVDGRFLSEELERLQCERIGPVIDVTVISGKLEEAHLPHYACLEKSYPSLKYAVKVLGILESVELTCFHAKILQPSFWPTTVIKEKGIPVEQHLDLLIFMTSEDPLILHVYFLPLFDTFSKEKIKQEETANNPHVLEIEHPSPGMKTQMDTPHVLKVSGASVDSEEGITFLSSIHPVFFKIKQDVDGDVQMTLIKQQHEMFVWKTIIWKDKLNQKKQEMRDLMARFGRLSTEMRKHIPEGQKRKPRKGWSDIILHYKVSVIDKCKFVTKCNLPTDECVELAGRYTEPVIIQRSKEQNEKYYHEHVRSAHASGLNTSSHLLSNDKNHSIRIDQLFSPNCDKNTPKTVILSGDSGRGKSFTLQKIMLDWAFGKLYYKNFNVIFLLKCEELKCISEEMSLFELLSWSCSLTLDQISQILELTPEKVLILIDGIDEYVSHPPSHSMLVLTNPSDRARPMDILRSVLKGILLPETFMLVTTRSLAADAVMNLLKGPQRFTEIVGFSERGVQEYFQKFFQDEQLFRKTYERVKINESLLTACSVPLLCWMVCFCLKKHFTDDDHVMRKLKTNTSIYVHFVSTLLEHHDQSQSVLTMLRSLGQRAEEGVKKREGLFVEKSVTATGLDPATNVFLYKDSLKRNNRQVPVFKFMHLSFQEFFTALYYVLLDKKESWGKVTDLLTSLKMKGIINRPSPERRSNPIPSVVMFLCGLLNEKASSSLFEMIKWTVPQIIKLKTNLQESLLTVIRHNGCELFALRCLYELQDENVVRRALGDWVSMNLYNISLKSTDCWVLLYCLECCPHVRYLNLMYCDLTAEKLKILQPALCMCENMRLSVKHLSEVGDLIQILGKSKFLKKMRVQESENSAESPRWSLDLSVTHGDVLLSLSSSEKNPSFPAVLNITLTCPQSEISSTDWSLFLQRLSKTEKVAEDSSALDEHVSLLLSSFHSVGLKTLNLKLVSLNKSWASGIIFLAQTCTSLQQLSVSVSGLLLEEGLMFLKTSLTEPHCTVIIEGRKCSKLTDQCKEQDWSHICNEKVEIHLKPKVLKKLEEPTISDSEPSGLNLQRLPVCQSCVHIGDSDQWVQVEPSLCKDEGGSEFRISTPAGRFECSRTRMRWVCAGDVTLQYRAMDGGFLSEELERIQCERIGPVIDVTVISGKLEEAHLPHYACLAESDPSLTRSVKVLSVEDEGISLESVELTRFHAKVLQPSFSPKTVLMKLGISVKVHCDLLIFMTQKNPIILHVYFFPSDSLFKEKIKTEEKQSHPIKCSRPETPLRMMKQHSLEVPGASVQPEAIKLRGDIEPNFFQVKHPVVNDIKMSLSRVDDQKSVWTATVWKELINMHPNRAETLFQTGQNQNTPQSAVNFDKVQFFDRNWCALIKSVENVNNIADNLLQKQIIHEELYSEITHPTSTSEASMRKICSIVRKGSDTVKEMFISILLEEDPNLLNHLPLPDS